MASGRNEARRIAFADIMDVDPVCSRGKVMDPQDDLDAPSIACRRENSFAHNAPIEVFQLSSGRVALCRQPACGSQARNRLSRAIEILLNASTHSLSLVRYKTNDYSAPVAPQA